MNARLSWRQVAYYLNGAGYYAKRPPSKNEPGRDQGFSLRENGDGSVLLTYSSSVLDADEGGRTEMLAAYASVLNKAGITYDLSASSIIVRGWHDAAEFVSLPGAMKERR